MNIIKNTQGITSITMMPTAYTKCVIGQDWYKNELYIDFAPKDCYPDYMAVNDWIMENIDGKEMNIEDVVNAVYTYIKEEYSPEHVTVENRIRGCKTHFDVTVRKE